MPTRSSENYDANKGLGFILKPQEPEVSETDPWNDDALDRKEVATALTNLVEDQTVPLTIGLHGEWGTGKTFLLKRWQEDLKKGGFRSVYFNAWEDDFCDDPLVAIIGQLSESLKDISEDIDDLRGKLIKNTKRVIKYVAGRSIVHGVNQITSGVVDLDEMLGAFADKTLDEYSNLNKNKNKLKKCLGQISEKIREEKDGKPFIFIIDELDRCRPTFAIELLERIKHIFDISGMIFVLGINQDELCSSIKSIYGEIDANTYLHRFFDYQFLLPEPNLERFCTHLFEIYGLQQALSNLNKQESHSHIIYFRDLVNLFQNFPALYNCAKLSLRDADHCVKALSFIGKSTKNIQDMHPFLIGVLIFIRLKEPSLYRGFIRGQYFAADVLNHLNKIIFEENENMLNFNSSYKENIPRIMEAIEFNFYATDTMRGRDSFEQLGNLIQDKEVEHPDYLSERIKKKYKEFTLIDQAIPNHPRFGIDIRYISRLIELVQISK